MTSRLFIDFVNSELFDGRGNREDRLEDPDWRRAFLERWGLPAKPLSRNDLDDLVALRAKVRSAINAVATGNRPSASAIRRLEEALAAHPVRFALQGDARARSVERIALSTRAADVIAGEVALSAARSLAEDDARRLKACHNPGCRWAFYDETKNRNRRWCRQCGNLDKVRRFRERQRMARDTVAGPRREA